MILVNLTCRRNPWKLASPEDASYRAFIYNPEFLKTILPISDELNQILGRIFTHNPAERITLPQLRKAILACPRFTNHPPPMPQEPILQAFQGKDVANVFDQSLVQSHHKPTLAPDEDATADIHHEAPPSSHVFQDDAADGIVSEFHDFSPASLGSLSPCHIMDDSDDSDDSDVSDTFSECSNNSSSSMDGIESDARPKASVDTLSQDTPTEPSLRAFGETAMPNFSPPPQTFLRSHVPSLRNNALPSPPMSPRMVAVVTPAQDLHGHASSNLSFGLKTCLPQRGFSRRAPRSLPAPPSPGTTTSCQGLYEQVWNSVPQFWKFLGPPAPAFYPYPHLYHQTHLPVRPCLG